MTLEFLNDITSLAYCSAPYSRIWHNCSHCTTCFVLTSREIPFYHSALRSHRPLQLWYVNNCWYNWGVLKPLILPFSLMFSQGKCKEIRLLSPTAPDSSVLEFYIPFKILPMIWKSSGNKGVSAEVSVCPQMWKEDGIKGQILSCCHLRYHIH